MTAEDRQTLAQTVKARRMSLPGAPTQAQAAALAGLSEGSWSNVERAKPVTDRVLIKVARALGWTADSCQLILDGMEPIESDEPAASNGDTHGDPPADRISRLEAQMSLVLDRLDTLTDQWGAAAEGPSSRR